MNKPVNLLTIAGFMVILLCLSPVQAQDKATVRVQQAFRSQEAGETLAVWVRFTDKDTKAENYARTAAGMTPRAAERRRDIPTDWFDLPVKNEYIDAVRATGAAIMRTSRWLNAVSVRMTNEQLDQIEKLSFVSQVEIAARFRRPIPETTKAADYDKSLLAALDYGPSYTQIHMLGIDSLHNIVLDPAGSPTPLNGSGVLIAFTDTGFRLNHPGTATIHVVDTYDFINNDAIVDDNLPSSSQLRHGTATLSTCGGYDPGQIIGPAYGADYLLAKTEYVVDEIIEEEENWVAALEWADSLGADIVSSSLGWNLWYDYSEMDGNTAISTVAADIAASRGIIVVTSAGNEAGNSSWPYILAPADGDSVIAVGAVDANGIIASFSSIGPTADGRIKPEVVAMGVAVRCANYTGGYTNLNGTSLSCPLIAGSIALMIQANPYFRGKPDEIRRRLFESANRFQSPDNHYGYGLPNMVLAASPLLISPLGIITIQSGQTIQRLISVSAPPAATVSFETPDLPPNFSFSDNGDGTASLDITGIPADIGGREYEIIATAGDLADTMTFTVVTTAAGLEMTYGPNPFTDSLSLYFTQPRAGVYSIEIFAISGELVYEGTINGFDSHFSWNGRNRGGEKVASGVYIIHISADGIDEKVKVFKL